MATPRFSRSVAFNLERAEDSLGHAREFLRRGDYIDSIEHSFRAGESAVYAFLLSRNPRTRIRTHEGILTVLGRDHIQKGGAPREWGRALNRLGGARGLFSYARMPEEAPGKEEARGALRLAEGLLQSVQRVVGRKRGVRASS